MMLLELTVELSQRYLISKIIDEGIRQQDLSIVWLWGSVLVGSAVIAFMAGIASSFFASHASQGFGYDLREKLYRKVQSFSYPVFKRFATSSLITRLTGDVTQVQDMVFMSLRFMTRVPLVVIGSIVMALVVHFRLGLLLAIMTPVLFVFVLQDSFLFQGTIRENIRFGRLEATDEEVEEASRLANAHSFIMRMKDGYDKVWEANGSGISQGQKQLLAIARAILANPSILVLDEATSSIDTITEMKIQEGLERLMQGRTSFVIAHRLNTIRQADRILVLKDGRLVEQGSHDALLAHKGFYSALYEGQLEKQGS